MAKQSYKIINGKQIYPQRPNGDEYVLNKTYALDSNNKPYYPQDANRNSFFVMHEENVPFFIENNNTVSFVNIVTHKGQSYYVAKSNIVGFLYKIVMSQISTDLTNKYYSAWKKAGLTTELFRFYKNYYNAIKYINREPIVYDIKIYVRHQNEYFTFRGDEEVAVHFDSVNKLHFVKNETIYFEQYIDGSELHYILLDDKHKLYFEEVRGILADGFIYYVPFPGQRVQILGTHKTINLPQKFGQDIDSNGSIYCYTIDSNSDREYFFYYGNRYDDPTEKIRFFDYDIYRMLRYEYVWNNGLKEYLPGDEPAEDVSSTHDLNANYIEINGRQIYPKHKGSEFCYERLGYARDENDKPYYPTHADGRIMIFSNSLGKPMFINSEDEPESSDDLSFYYDKIYFMGKTYYLPVPDEIIKQKIQDEKDRRQRIKDLLNKINASDDDDNNSLNRPLDNNPFAPPNINYLPINKLHSQTNLNYRQLIKKFVMIIIILIILLCSIKFMI